MSRSPADHNHNSNGNRLRRNHSNRSPNHRSLSDFVLERESRRTYRENASMSGSRTRSSSRTTSGNPDSSRSRSASPSSEEKKENFEPNKAPLRRKRFLQRWEDDYSLDSRNEKSPNEANSPEENSSSLPYVFQQAELIRISQDIIRKCDAEELLKEYFRTLDRGENFDLSLVSDKQLKKKLRHLSKALYLERNDLEFKKPPECKVSLFEVFSELLPFIKAKANSQGPYERKVTYEEPETQEFERDSKRKLTAEEASELLSLREMHEQGFFVDYDNIRKEFTDKNREEDLWGKTPGEQKSILSSDGNEPVEQPWKVFDREKDFLGVKHSTSKDYNNLLESTRNFKDSFEVVSKSSSFL